MIPYLCDDLFKLIKRLLKRFVQDDEMIKLTTPIFWNIQIYNFLGIYKLSFGILQLLLGYTNPEGCLADQGQAF